MTRGLRLGLIVNPIAGIGGAVGLMGSDGGGIQREARARASVGRSPERCAAFLGFLKAELGPNFDGLNWLTWGGSMGADHLGQDLRDSQVLGSATTTSSGQDTTDAARALAGKVDLLVFVGGDGTARDVLQGIPDDCLVLGLPSGVKMHSGVFAISPSSAAEVVLGLVSGGLVGRELREVRDYLPTAEPSLGTGRAQQPGVTTKTYGEMWVPQASGFVQQMKVGGKEDEGLVVEEIIAHLNQQLPERADQALVFAPGSTCLAIKEAFGLSGSLLGCDALLPGGEARTNLTAQELVHIAEGYPVKLILSFTRHQGFLLGRGNQQLCEAFLKRIAWPEDVIVVGSRTKLSSLEQRPLLLDTGDRELDDALSGLMPILTGFEQSLLYRVDCGG